MNALADVTVLDLSHALAGPFASTMLADYGAEVIKIEAPGVGDVARAWGPSFYGDEAAYFVNLHRNKKSIGGVRTPAPLLGEHTGQVLRARGSDSVIGR